MRTTTVKLWLLASLVAVVSGGTAAEPAGSMSGTGPSFKYLGPLALGPDGVIFAADSQEVSVYALELKEVLKSGTPGTKDVANIDQKVAALLGTDAASLTITDMLVYPPTRNTLVSVMRGEGPSAVPALVKVDGAGKLELIALSKARYSKVAIPNPPPPVTPFSVGPRTFDVQNYPNRPKDNSLIGQLLGTQTITHMAYEGGRLYVSGLSNEEFASKLRSIPYPFVTVDRGTGVEIWHTSHGQFETRSPVFSFVPYKSKGEAYIIASYLCTPLVRFPISSLKPGAEVRGETIAEFGNANRPLDMIVYTKGGLDFLLIANNKRGVMKVAASGLATAAPITKQVQIEDRVGLVPEPVPSMQGVEQLDKLDAMHAVVLTRADRGVDLHAVALP